MGFLDRQRAELDLSSADLDGSHTTAKRGGQSVAYQGRKKLMTTNALYLTDRQGLPLAMSEPVAGNHNDLYDIEVQFEVVTATLEKADIPVEGLFVNADAGFDLTRRTSGTPAGRRASTPTYVSTNATAMPTGTNISIKTYTMSAIRWNVPTRGWTAIARC